MPEFENPSEIVANFQVPQLDVQTGTYGKIELTATLFATSAESNIFVNEFREYLDSVQTAVDQSFDSVIQQLTVDVQGRLGYRYTINTQNVADYTLVLADEGTMLRMTSGSANNVYVPDNATVPFEIGTIINIRQAGAGVTTVVPAAGVTINSPDNLEADGTAHGIALVKVGTNEWDLIKSFVGVPINEVQDVLTEFDNINTAIADLTTTVDDGATTTDGRIDQVEGDANSAIAALDGRVGALEGAQITTASFPRQLGATGYQKLPGGLILIWGDVVIPGNNQEAIFDFPNTGGATGFPTACLQAYVSSHGLPDTNNPNYSGSPESYAEIHAAIKEVTQTRVTIVTRRFGGHGQDEVIARVFAIGY